MVNYAKIEIHTDIHFGILELKHIFVGILWSS